MLGKLISKIKNKEESPDKKHLELVDKISKMNLVDMRAYVKNSMQGFETSEEGLVEVLKKLTEVNSTNSKRYIELDDMDDKIRKAFELILLISVDKRMTIDALELIQEFTKIYSDVILQYDTKHKQIYASRLKDAIEQGILAITKKANFETKQKVLNN